MTKEEFIESFVKIDLIEGQNPTAYGFYPFHLVAEKADGGLEVNALLLGGDVYAVYLRAAGYVAADAKTIYLAVDFPGSGDITSDFVAVFEVQDKVATVMAIPYSNVTGDVWEEFHESTLLTEILDQFKRVTGCH